MTPPDDGGRVPDPVLTIILETLRKLESTVGSLRSDLHLELSRLPEMYVPRREVEHRLDEHTIDIGEVRAQLGQKMSRHDTDVKAIRDSIETLEERRKAERKADEHRRETYRRWAIGIAVPALFALAMLVIAVLNLMARTS